MRSNWTKQGVCVFYLKAFFYIFIGQGVASLIVNSAGLFITIYTSDNTLDWTAYVGLAIWLFGFTFEVVGDAQLAIHLKRCQKAGKKELITWGLWRITRHPNYFGEAVLWWGIWVIACGLQYGWATFYAPLVIGLLLRFVSGVPLLEKKYKGRPDWEQYCHETNCFFPWCVNRKPMPAAAKASDSEVKKEENA